MKKYTILFFFLMLGSFAAQETPGWSFTTTDHNHVVAITLGIQPNIDGELLENGDYIGAFFKRNDSLICAGYVIWSGTENKSITIWGDDNQTSLKDGFTGSEEFNWLIWKKDEQRTYLGQAEFASGPSEFISNGTSSLSLLSNKQPDWKTEETNYSHTFKITSATEFNLAQFVLGAGDYIGAFYDSSGVLVNSGSIMWKGSADSDLITYGDDPVSSDKDGFEVGENVNWKVWIAEKDTFLNVSSTIASGPETFTINGVSIIDRFDIDSVDGPDWQFEQTDINHIIAIPVNASPKIDDEPLTEGDYIGVFYDDASKSKCAGYGIWNGTNSIAVTAWGDDARTDEKEGFVANEVFSWKVWSSKTKEEYEALVTYDFTQPNDSIFVSNGLSAISSLVALADFDSTDIVDTVNQVKLDVTYRFRDYEELKGYRIIGLPGASSIPLKDHMFGNPISDWVAFYDDGNTVYIPYSKENEDIFNFGNGKAFWVIGKKKLQVDSLTVQRAKPNSSNVYEIPLHSGWNLITNPYINSVKWEDVRSANNISDNIYHFSRGRFLNGSYSFEPYVGYYFYNRNNLSKLKIPYLPAAASKVKKQNNSYESKLSLILETEDSLNSEVKITIDENSKKTLDMKDQFSPPDNFEESKIFLSNQQIDRNYKYLAEEARPMSIENGETFNILVKGNPGDSIKIKVEDALFEENLQYLLLNQFDYKLYDIKKDSVLKLYQYEKYDEYRLVVGSKEFVDENPVPELPTQSTLYQNYPNPFNPSTTIKYYLKYSSKVTVSIYNSLGERVEKLVETTQNSGVHSFNWNAENLSSGIYIYNIVAIPINKSPIYSTTKKMILLK